VTRALVLAAALALWTLPGSAQTGSAPNPVMSKGPAAAPVTIVEFSDYQ
jgi:hypothetical protein